MLNRLGCGIFDLYLGSIFNKRRRLLLYQADITHLKMPTYQKIAFNLVLFGLIIGLVSSARAQETGPVFLENDQTSYPLGLHLEYLEDPGGKLTVDEVSGPEFADRFNLNRVDVPNFGVTESAYWIRFRIRNDNSQAQEWRLAFTNARMGLVDLFVSAPNDSGWTHQEAGTYLPDTVRQYAHPHIVFPLTLPLSSDTIIYLRLESNLPMRFSLSLWSADSFEQYNHSYFSFTGFFYGIVAIMMVYNLLLYLFNRRITYLFYFLFVFAYALNTASNDGTANLYLFPNFSTKYNIYGIATLGVIFYSLFIRSFLELRSRVPWLNRLLTAIPVITVLAFALYALYPPGFVMGSLIVYLSILLISILAIVGGILVWRQGLFSARYYLIGMSGLLLNTILVNSTNASIIRNYPLFDVGQYISTLVLIIFLSLAMTDQINELKVQATQSEAARRESEKRFQLVYESSPLGIFIANKDGLIIQGNRALQNMLGYNEYEFHHMHIFNLIHPDFRQLTVSMYQSVLTGELAQYDTEAKYIRKDGSPIWVRRSVAALYDGKGNIQHTFAIISDITQQKRDEEELLHYKENLEEKIAIRTRELEHSREQLAILNRASQAVNAAGLDVNKLYVTIRAASAWMVPAEVFAISLVDRSAGEYEDVFLADGDRRLSGGCHPLENSVTERILASGNSVKIDDFQSQPSENWGSHWAEYCPGVRSGIAVLLHGDNRFLGILSVQSYQPSTYQDSDLSALESLAAHASIAIENLQLHQQAQKAVVVEERQRLARELHDSVTQLLYSIALLGGGWGLKARKGRLPDPKSSFAQIEDLSLQALKEMRLLIYQLRPPLLDELGIVNALQHRLETVEQRVNIDARLMVEGDFPNLPRNVEEQVYHIVQEALNNALRHAHATIIEIRMQSINNLFHIAIEDNGRGIDPTKRSNGMGMQSMRERARAIAAEIVIDSVPGQGTKVELTLKSVTTGG